ncbi:DUF3050 domain-containing protein [Aureivirga sp. CE67]|uniref:DUF3050 domain-containing protein n=1 Tax=Aureivirga sp. CE67 TaxID=1788983 RepID=UPI0018CADA06|nr:DUF3050 domain-containing protein [Aureivirga sp. CE67]
MNYLEDLEKELAPYRKQLIEHSLYQNIKTIEDVQTFMEYHVYAVWDFMSLLKSLQNLLTCTTIPWTPKGNPITRRFINEIVLGEETDVDSDKNPVSHYEMYLDAMLEIKASTASIVQFVKEIQNGATYTEAATSVNLDSTVLDFLDFTFDTIKSQKSHVIAAVFTFGREDLIPDMFTEIVKNIGSETNISIEKLIYYLERHIELDGDEHGPMSLQMISELCIEDATKWQEVKEASIIALQKRIQLWDAIEKSILNR